MTDHVWLIRTGQIGAQKRMTTIFVCPIWLISVCHSLKSTKKSLFGGVSGFREIPVTSLEPITEWINYSAFDSGHFALSNAI